MSITCGVIPPTVSEQKSAPTLTVALSARSDHAAQRGAVRRPAADGIVLVVVDEQVLVGAGFGERIEAGQAQLGRAHV